MRVWLDFETFSAKPLRGTNAVGPSRYAEDESTIPLCLAYAIGNGPVRVWVDLDHNELPDGMVETSLVDLVPHHGPPPDLARAIAAGAKMWAHNAEFDLCIWNRFYAPLPVSQWRDSMAITALHALPLSLEGATTAVRQQHLKDPRGTYLINQLCKPKRATKKDPSTRREPSSFPVLFDDLYRYCAADVEAMRELVLSLPQSELDEREQAAWELTIRGNLIGLPVDLEEVRTMRRAIADYEEHCRREVVRITDGAVKTAGQRDKIIAWCATRGVDIPDIKQKTIDDLVKAGGLPEDVQRFFYLRRQVGRVSTKKFAAVLNRACADGTVKNNLVYWGAGPGRFAGRGFQVQNLPRLSTVDKEKVSTRPGAYDEACDRAFEALSFGRDAVEMIYTDFMTYASGMIRATIKAPVGYEFMSGDYSSIENRLTLWCGGEEDGLEKFRRGMDQYKDFAHKHHGVAYEDVTYQQRVDAKAIVLGCGFGMGWEKFMRTCWEKGTPITEEKAKEGVEAFRTIYPGVPQFWYGCADAAKRAIKKPGITATYENQFMKLKFRCENGWLKMRLPSGRHIQYYKPVLRLLPAPWDPSKKLETITHMGFNLKKQWVRLKLIPGRIAENAVQGIARDIMVLGMLAAQERKYTVVTTIHDEVLSMVPAGWGSVEEFCKIISPRPAWLGDFPLVAEGWRGRRYRK